MLSTLSAKRDLALAALDVESQVGEVDVRTGAAALKQRLEVLLGAKPEAPEDRVALARTGIVQNAPLVEAGRTLLRAAAGFVVKLGETAPRERTGLEAILDAKVHAGDDGRARLSLALPSDDQIEALAQGFVALLARFGSHSSPASTEAPTTANPPN